MTDGPKPTSGIFRKAAPGEFEINIPGIAESPVNRIIRKAYSGKHKGDPTTLTRTPDDKLYPRGFTPPADFISDIDKAQGVYNLSNITKNVYQDLPVEAGLQVNLDGKVKRALQHSYLSLQESPLRFFNSPSVQFRHLLEYNDTSEKKGVNPLSDGSDGNRPGVTYDFDDNGNLTNPTYFASFVKTQRQNEDPTLLGFDFYINLTNSPLFNGTCQKFLEDYGTQNTELSNRLELLLEFQKHFLGFFQTYHPNHLNENLPSVGDFSNGSGVSKNLTNKLLKEKKDKSNNTLNYMGQKYPSDSAKDMTETYLGSDAKAYYIQSISGLDKLNESNSYSEGQRFVKWGTDFLTLSLNEDVSQNMGYLASLYKNLAWSRERGRLAIPENLLRFEVVLDITEVRNYVRIYHNSAAVEFGPQNSSGIQQNAFGLVDLPDVPIGNPTANKDWITIADQTSKYRYFVHECQFFFDKMPHGDVVTNTPTEPLKGLDLKIFFKHSNLRFMKFSPPLSAKVQGDDYSAYSARFVDKRLNTIDPYFGIKVVDNRQVLPATPDRLLRGGSGTRRKTIFDDGDGNEISENNASPIGYPIEVMNDLSQRVLNNGSSETGLSDEERRRQINQQPTFADQLKVGIKDRFKRIKRAALGTAINLVNTQLLSVASLVNRTLNQIYNSTPVIGGIKPPKNIYEAPNEFEQAYIDFVGPGLRKFFEDPLKFRKEGIVGETLEQRIQRGRSINPNPGQGRDLVDYFQLANQGTPTVKNLKLQEIVDADPGLGNGFSGASQVPFLGNSADPGTNRTLKQIVDSNPGLGNGFSGASQVPFLGNSADPGTNRTLKQIVDSNPSLGIPGSLISTSPSLGNNADSGNNLTLNQLVSQSPDLGIPGSNIPSNPSLGNNADTGVNLLLQTIVDKDPDLGIPGSNIPQNPSLGNNAEIGDNLNLQSIVDSDPNFGIPGSNISISPSIGNSSLIGDNIPNNLVVSQNTNLQNSFLGNSAQIGNQLPNNLVVVSNTQLVQPNIGNSGEIGENILNQQLVSTNTQQINPQLGNSGEIGENILNQQLVSIMTQQINPQLGNSGQLGVGIPKDELVSNKTQVSNSNLGNSGQLGINISNDELINNQSQVSNSNLGNSGRLGFNGKISDLLGDKSSINNPEIGNSSEFGQNIRLNEVISENTSLEDTSSTNGVNNKNEDTIRQNSKIENPQIGNSGQIGVVIDKNDTINQNTQLDNSNIGNSAQFGKNNNIRFDINGISDGRSIGNSAVSGQNVDLDDKRKSFGNTLDLSIGNSGELSDNESIQTKINENSTLQDTLNLKNRNIGQRVQLNDIVENNRSNRQPISGNSGTLGGNLKLNEFSKYSNSRILGTVDWNNIQFPKSAQRYPPPTSEK